MTTAPSTACTYIFRDGTFCPRPRYRDDAYCVFHSQRPDKGEAFWEAWEEQVANKDWKCQGYRFPGDLDLSNQLLVDADFGEAKFEGDASFAGATFSGLADFWGATFSGNASFWGATFEKPVWWWWTTLASGSFFDDVLWPEGTTFEKVRLGSSTFTRSDLRHVTFRRCHLGDASLAEAHSLALAEYDQVTWGLRREHPLRLLRSLLGSLARPRRRRPLGRVLRRCGHVFPRGEARPVTREEREARQRNSREAFETAARVYRELRRSYEEHKNFAEANHFAYGELEMRRLALGRGSNPQRWWQRGWGALRRNLLSLEALYFHTSTYGQSWPRASLWMLAFVGLLFPWGYAFARLDLGVGPFALRWLWESGADTAAYFDLLVFSLRTAALLPEPTEAMLSAGAQFLQVVERVLSPLLGTLLIMAVRRRFRR